MGDNIGTGFSVHPDNLGSAGDQLTTAGDDVASTRDTLGRLDMSDADTFGEYGAPEAAKAFWSAWQDELGVNTDALHDLGNRVRTTAGNYSTSDQQISQHLQGR
ncbi:type VII secretion target [Kitasatospora sp. NBC_01287]|uniref:type VII secretion target n=1 Tax=Kitasatospora sp. NBC_01287 TaxID=2903573 RepID=UPI00224D3CCD|nr:type VII secretion target [Kitasatospora sp. NBC_01287]MCX4745708.1 type VII secretion target [Kitasatospora sp. NBC_01287]